MTTTKDLVEKLAATAVRCLEMESVTSVRMAADTLRSGLAVIDATVCVMECAGRLSDLRLITGRAEELREAFEDAETALASTEHYLETLQGEGEGDSGGD